MTLRRAVLQNVDIHLGRTLLCFQFRLGLALLGFWDLLMFNVNANRGGIDYW